MRAHKKIVLVVVAMIGLGGAAGSRAQEDDGYLTCNANALAQAMRDLFPPAPDQARVASAARLSTCRPPGSEGAVAAALGLAEDEATQLAMANALAAFKTPVAFDALTRTARGQGALPVREAAMNALASSGRVTDVLEVLVDQSESEGARKSALAAVTRAKGRPSARYLAWLNLRAGPQLQAAINELGASRAPDAGAPAQSHAAARADAPAASLPSEGDETAQAAARAAGIQLSPAPAGATAAPAATGGAAVAVTPSADAEGAVAPAPPPAPTGPLDGTPLGIGTATVAGAALMLNLSLLGVQDPTPQLLLGSAGAVIGFGTSWGLSRFGYRPTMEQAAWFANATAWGTLAGITIYSASGVDNYKLRYGSMAAGEIAGMAAGVWSGRKYAFTGPQIVMADSLVLGAGLGVFGLARFRSDNPRTSLPVALGVVPTMVASAIAAHRLSPTTNDLRLMTAVTLDAGWLSGLLASGATRQGLFDSHQGQGGMLLGLGVGYLGGVAAGAFTEVSVPRLAMGEAGLLLGNGLGYGIHMMGSGFSHRDGSGFAAGESDAWKLGAGVGGLALASAGLVLGPRLHPGPKGFEMAAWGAAYGAGTYWLALTVARSSTVAVDEDVRQARLKGGMLATGVAGGIAGWMLSRHFQPDEGDDLTALGATAAGAAAGWGTVALLTRDSGLSDALGVATGAALGLSGGALFTHRARLTAPALGASLVGGSYGALLGTLLPTLGDPYWKSDRQTSGGAMLGLGGGALAGAALAQATGATRGQVLVPAVAGALGLGAGTGLGMMLVRPAEQTTTQPVRIGAAVGTASLLAASMVGDHWLRLSDGLGASATGLSLLGAGFGMTEGAFLAATLGGDGTVSGARDDARTGGMLMGASVGVASGLVLSRRVHPTGGDMVFAGASSLLLTSAGFGLGETLTGTPGRASSVAAMSGAAVGLVGGALIAPHVQLTPPILLAATTAGAAGALIGALAPSLDDDTRVPDARSDGGTRLGLAAGILGGGALAKATNATTPEVTAVSIAASVGLGAGLGAGTMWPQDGTRHERIGAVVGTAALGTAGALLVRPLHLAEPLKGDAGKVILTTTALGIYDGFLLAALVDPSGAPSKTPTYQKQGGALLGGALGLGTGLMLAQRMEPKAGRTSLWLGGTAAGTSMGWGLALTLAPKASVGRADSTGLLVGSMVGTAAGAVAAAKLEPVAADTGAALTGAGYGALMGALTPTLRATAWRPGERDTWGGLLLGAGAGAAGGFGLRRALGGDGRAVALTAVAGADGMVTGIGWGLLLDPSDRAQGARIGTVAGAAAGLGLGMANWSRLTLGPGDSGMIAAATALGAWNGAWLPQLGHASAKNGDDPAVVGGAMAVGGTASFAAALLAPVVELDSDLSQDALVMDAVFSGAGAGVGALASTRDDAPVAGLLIGGAAGLVLGGAAHDRLKFEGARAPLMVLGAVEGLWAGALLPHVLRTPEMITDRQRTGATTAGAFGGLGLGILASSVFAPTPAQVGFASLGSGIGAAIAGGVALASEQVEDRAAAGLTLAGTGLGLATAGWLAPRLDLQPKIAGAATLGAVLGGSEAMLFAWSSRASGKDAYAGAALVGAGVGAGLGIASVTRLELSRSLSPATAGFTAWGAWVGSFSGSLLARDPHEVTTGGLLGSNLGLLAGMGLLRSGLVEASDFGWLSLAGAMGTVAGAAVGAPFTSRGQPKPILAGLAIGPVVGMVAGAFALPHLRRPGTTTTASDDLPSNFSSSSSGSSRAGFFSRIARAVGPRHRATAPGMANPSVNSGSSPSSAEMAQLDAHEGLGKRFARALDATIQVSDCAPLIGALPTPDASAPGTSPPFIAGITGRWR